MSDDRRPETVGGQAVIDGVMMRAPNGWAVAVRSPSGQIDAIKHDLPRLSSRSRWARIPLIRGVLVLGESLSLGFRALSWSAQKASEEEEKPLSSRQLTITMTIALLFFAGLFIVLPALIARFSGVADSITFNVIEGAIRLGLFVGYLWLIGRSDEIGRVFEYHGAEHMTIHAYEAGEPLTVEAVARYRPEHPRCGTSFLLIVVVASIVVFSFLGRPGLLLMIASRIVLIPLIAGVAYEILHFAGKTRSQWFGRILAAPGLWLQRLTTRHPEPMQIEVAIASMVAALDDERLSEVAGRGDICKVALAARPQLSER